jgi:hypothetical protein
MPQPPALCPERRERTLHVVLRASTDAAATGEREPVASAEAEAERGEEQQSGERGRSRAPDNQREHRRNGASQRRLAGVTKPAILLAASVVGHSITKVWRHATMFPT